MIKRVFRKFINDTVFKCITNKNPDVIKWVLNGTFKILNRKYYLNKFNLRNCELTKDKVYLKSRTMDTLIETDDHIFNIELNGIFNKETIIRNYIYVCNYLIYMIKKNMKYKYSIKPITQINYNLHTPKSLDYNGVYRDLEIESYKEYEFIKEIINIDIEYYMDLWYNSNKEEIIFEEYKYIIVFGMTEEDWLELESDDEMVNKIKNEIFNLNDPNDFPRLFTDEEFLEIEKNTSFEQGIEQGIQKGIQQNKLENAKSMKLENIPANVIKKITGLDLNTIAML